jgi:hypothetical protein
MTGRQRLIGSLVLVVAALGAVAAATLDTSVLSRADVGCRDEVRILQGAPQTVSNCSAAPTDKIVDLLRRTDAAYLGLIRVGDRLMANNQWVLWIDTQDAPGVLRGLWPIHANGDFAGITEPDIAPDAAKDVLAVGKGYYSTRAPIGYKGLHVEIWKTAQQSPTIRDECIPGSCFYSVPNGVRYQDQPDTLAVTPSQSVATYHSPLANNTFKECPTCGTTRFLGINGVETQLLWSVRYAMTPDTFTIETALTAGRDVDFDGDAGGLLLMFNAGCAELPRNAYPGDDHFANCLPSSVENRAIHRVDGPAIRGGRIMLSDNVAVTTEGADLFAPERQVIGPDEDRFVGQTDDSSPMTFRYGSGSFRMTVKPGWQVTDPLHQRWEGGLATHFNGTPRALGWDAERRLSGLSGIGSVDNYIRSPKGGACPDAVCLLAVGPTRGALFWRMEISR